ncbi:unnamed protein product, partial [Cyprideis torosa]
MPRKRKSSATEESPVEETSKGRKRSKSAGEPSTPKTPLNPTGTDLSSIDFETIAQGHLYVEAEKPDILCLQETKCELGDLPKEARHLADYHLAYLGSPMKKGHGGVAIYSKEKPLSTTYGLKGHTFDNSGRLITVEFDKFFLVNTCELSVRSG